jgi:quinol monooxygenase YgiN
MTMDEAAPFALVVRFTVRPGAEADFDDLIARTTAAIRAREPGTLVYACHRVEGQPRQRMFYELYRDRAAFEAHEQQDHVQHFLAAREDLLESTVVDRLMLSDGKTPAVGAAAADRG